MSRTLFLFINKYIKALKQRSSMNNSQLKSFYDRFEEQIKQCDQELRKMLIDCQLLKDEQHYEADFYQKKITNLQNQSLELRTTILNELDTSKLKKNVLQTLTKEIANASSFLEWIDKKKVISRASVFLFSFSSTN
jgi:hypothetical protein